MSKRVLVTGVSGLLGSNIAKIIEKWENHQIFGTYHKNEVEIGNNAFTLDLTNEKHMEKVVDVAPEVIIHTAAYTDVDGCEENKEKAQEVNVEGTRRLVEKAEEIGSKFVYISTDYVFDGKRGGYKEEDEVNPVNYYGETKLEGEKLVSKLDDSLICRVCVLFGLEPTAKLNFAIWILQELRNGRQIDLIDDQFVTPTLASNAAHAIKFLLENDKNGIYHISGRECVNRHEFGMQLADIFGLDKSLIKRSKMREMPWDAKRPRNSCLNTEKIRREGFTMMNVEESLRELKRQEKEGWFK